MNVALWVVQAALAVAFLFTGGNKILRSKDALAKLGMTFVEDFSAMSVKLIGAAEVLGALGLILPRATGIAPVLTPIAAVGLAIIMIGAAVTHLRRKESKAVGPNVLLFVLAAFVAVGRFITG
jgi:uncharacterized membrane protein YphA (DoxX/SURF4 family)